MVKVLLIEASEKIQKQIEEALKRIRFESVHTSWAEEALELLEKESFDAIMVHDNLGGMSALAFVKAVRKKARFKDYPVILFYGKCDPIRRMEAWRAGVNDVIEMPFVLPEVLLRLNVRLRNIGKIQTISRRLADSIEAETEDLTEGLPCHGTIDRRPLPFCLSMLHLSRKTGVIRLIEGKHMRLFYLENGYLRGVHSSKKEESLQRLMLKWIDFPGDTKRYFKSLPDTTPDQECVRSARQVCGLQDEAIDSIIVRYMHHVANGAIQSAKGEFDWTENEQPDDIQMTKFRGVHPVHLLLTVVRDTAPVLNYDSLITNTDWYVAPSTRNGVIRDTFRLTAPEVCVAAMTAKGITIGEWLKQAKSILPYASSFLYVMLQFRIFNSVERSELTPDEIDVVALPEPLTAEDLQSSDNLIKDEPAPETEEETPGSAPPDTDTATPKKPDDGGIDEGSEQGNGITEVDKRPVGKRVIKTTKTPPEKNLLEKELEKFGQQTTPHQRYQSIQKKMAQKGKGPHYAPSALELFKLDRDALTEGHTWDTHPALICMLVINHHATGVLQFSDAASETRLYWQKGRLVYAKSNKSTLRIDQVLFDLGLINAQQREAASQLWDASGGMRSGTGLYQNNIVNVMDLTEAVKEQIRLIIRDICNMPAGDYSFAAGALPQNECIPFDIATERVLIQGIREMDELGNLDRIVPNLNTIFHQSPGASEKAQELHLEGCDIAVLNRFRKPTSAKSAFAGMDISLQAFKNVLAGLYLIGLLKKQVSS